MFLGPILILIFVGGLIAWLSIKLRQKHRALKLIREFAEQEKPGGAVDSIRNVLTSHGY